MEESEDPTPSTLMCYLCNQRFRRPQLLPCLHVFCLTCLQDECQGNSPDKFFCPLCVTANEKDRKSVNARPWHSFERIIEKETEDEELQNRLAELPAFDEQDSFDAVVESDDSGSGNSKSQNRNQYAESNDDNIAKSSTVLEPPLVFPCTMHADRLADTFCFKCQQLACHKCVSSFHRRCQQFSELKAAVETKRTEFEEIHSKMASNFVSCNEVETYQSERIKHLEEMRTRVLIEIKSFRTELVNMILAKEKTLTTQANHLIDQMKTEATAKLNIASKMSESLQKQMEFLDISISVKGEGELLPLFPGMTKGIEDDANLIGAQYSDEIKDLVFTRDESCKDTINKSVLGEVTVTNTEDDENDALTGSRRRRDLDLTLVTSFHGGTRDDVTEPLLTDLILLANGDVIATDRDNKCVKKFNQAGKLLTRVLIDAVPSRIANVSHGRAVVSVMTKKSLYFLSLFGTVRILNSVPVKKIYSFLTSIGNGLLIAGTNQCDSIDLISERGETIKKIFTQKPDRAIIARPLYLTPIVPHSMISQKLNRQSTSTESSNSNHTHKQDIASSNDNSDQNNINSNTKTTSTISKVTKDNAAMISNNNNNGNTTTNSKNNNVLQKSLTSNKPVLPQISKNGKNGGATGTGSQQPQQNASTSPSAANSASKTSRRRTSLPATPHTSSETNSPMSSQNMSSSMHSSSTSSLLSTSTLDQKTSSNHSHEQKPLSSSDIALLVSDSGKRVLFRMEQDGSTSFILKSNDQVTLECPLGVTVHESGLTLLSDRDTDSVILLDETGNVLKSVLTAKEGLNKPCGIYAGNKGTVALSQVDGMVKIYKPKRNT